MAQPALRIYEMDIPRRDKPEQTFHVTFYSPNENAALRACVIAIHGTGENANRYRLMAKEALVPAGIILVVPDLPGYGQTSGKAGVSSADAALGVIDETVQLISEQTKGLPIFLYGHSMGGNLALNYLLNQEEHVAEDGTSTFVANPHNVFHAAIISSPWLKLARRTPDFLMKVIRFIGGLFPNATTSSRLKLERLCNDHKVLQDREQDKFCNGRISYKMLADMWASGQRALDHAQNIHLPLLLMYGSADQIVSPTAIEELANKLPPYMNSVRFDEFMHEIHNMQERDAVYETMLEFIQLCLQRGNVPVPARPQPTAAEPIQVVETEEGVADLDEEALEQNLEAAEAGYDPVDTYADNYEETEAYEAERVFAPAEDYPRSGDFPQPNNEDLVDDAKSHATAVADEVVSFTDFSAGTEDPKTKV